MRSEAHGAGSFTGQKLTAGSVPSLYVPVMHAHLLRPARSRAPAARVTQASSATASAAAAGRRRGAGMVASVGPRRRLRGAAGLRRPVERLRSAFQGQETTGGCRRGGGTPLKNAPPHRRAASAQPLEMLFYTIPTVPRALLHHPRGARAVGPHSTHCLLRSAGNWHQLLFGGMRG